MSEKTDKNSYSLLYEKYLSENLKSEEYTPLEGYEKQILVNSNAISDVKGATTCKSFPPVRELSKISEILVNENLFLIKNRKIFNQVARSHGMGIKSKVVLLKEICSPKLLATIGSLLVVGAVYRFFIGLGEEEDRKFHEGLQRVLTPNEMLSPNSAIGGLGRAFVASFWMSILPRRVSNYFGLAQMDNGASQFFGALRPYLYRYTKIKSKTMIQHIILTLVFQNYARIISSIFSERVARYFAIKAMARGTDKATREGGATTNHRIGTVSAAAYDMIYDFMNEVFSEAFSFLHSLYYFLSFCRKNDALLKVSKSFITENVRHVTNTSFYSAASTFFKTVHYLKYWILMVIFFQIVAWGFREIYCDGRSHLVISNEASKGDEAKWAGSASILAEHKLAKNYDLNGWYYYLLIRNNLAFFVFKIRSLISTSIGAFESRTSHWNYVNLARYLLAPDAISLVTAGTVLSSSDDENSIGCLDLFAKLSGLVHGFFRLIPLVATGYHLMNALPNYIRQTNEGMILALKLEEDFFEQDQSLIEMEYLESEIKNKRVVLNEAKLSWLPKPVTLTLDLEDSPKWTYIIGPSGGGKTATTDLIMGLRSLTSAKEYCNYGNLKIHLLSQYPGFVHGTLEENITFSAKKDVNEDAFIKALDLSNILSLESRRNEMINPSAVSYSGGQCQRINFARFLYRWFILKEEERPDMLILDEAFSAIDVKNAKMIRSRLNALKIKYVLVTHSYSEITPEDKVFYIDSEKIISNTFEEIRKDAHVSKILFKQ